MVFVDAKLVQQSSSSSSLLHWLYACMYARTRRAFFSSSVCLCVCAYVYANTHTHTPAHKNEVTTIVLYRIGYDNCNNDEKEWRSIIYRLKLRTSYTNFLLPMYSLGTIYYQEWWQWITHMRSRTTHARLFTSTRIKAHLNRFIFLCHFLVFFYVIRWQQRPLQLILILNRMLNETRSVGCISNLYVVFSSCKDDDDRKQ
jgi:hypothetical protein